ncbi:MAG: hypothetical protein COY58_03400 [Gammaproteobacteria bacterium CG_4_10_14_0_8_um_filter_38_16]|nr:MAG: hypothetical protein COY58_03400 [Gammaproteobacteria bacterium CG_4_10_14_0_8_um_filter_38_16]PJA04145.1 MAG: hypothetical protein COX72_01565 [Gammaproteobacteria bacterium CG_4_10_14_0_2_um_filter_38_22]PJB11170.1 MAG: hypothetical protein CO120_00965 [Gammaproteobacteria bacterium CG_4_9_14_3_um_filter_38_9]
MKKLLIALFASLFSLAFITAQAAVIKKSSVSEADNNALIGNWVNVNSKTRGLDKLIIKKNSLDGLSISAFGKCHPKDCAWGNVPLITYGKSTTDKKMIYGLADWNPKFATTTMKIEKLSGNKIRVTIFTAFKDKSNRFNYAHADTLKPVK